MTVARVVTRTPTILRSATSRNDDSCADTSKTEDYEDRDYEAHTLERPGSGTIP